MKFTIFQATRQGPRPYNQDRSAYSYSKEALLLILADGMGGHAQGDLATRITVKSMTESFQHMATPILANPFKFLYEHIRQIHETLYSEALARGMDETPRTTVVAAVVQHNQLYCAHVGDSRLYHFRAGKLQYRTKDHSKVQLMLEKGEIKESELATHPERNKIYNCLGSDTTPQIELSQKRLLVNGDTVFLCTDGIWSFVEDEELGNVLQQSSVIQAVPSILDIAESRCGLNGDNMTALAFNWGGYTGAQFSVSTATMPVNHSTTTLLDPLWQSKNERESRLTEEEINRAIAEIQAAIKKSPP